MQCLNKSGVGLRWTRLTFLYANSSQVGQWIRAPSSARVQEAPTHTLALPLEALHLPGGLLEFFRDADHQTWRGHFDDAVRRAYLEKL
jgi:hypothetical protein